MTGPAELKSKQLGKCIIKPKCELKIIGSSFETWKSESKEEPTVMLMHDSFEKVHGVVQITVKGSSCSDS